MNSAYEPDARFHAHTSLAPVEEPYPTSSAVGRIQVKDTTASDPWDMALERHPGASPDSEGHDRRMPILHPAADPLRDPPASLVDGCPSCAINVEPPRSSIEVVNAIRNAYLCSDCGHVWTTDWRVA